MPTITRLEKKWAIIIIIELIIIENFKFKLCDHIKWSYLYVKARVSYPFGLIRKFFIKKLYAHGI